MAQQGILRYLRGLHKDAAPLGQPVGTVRFARNAVSNMVDDAISNEPGTSAIESLPADSIVIGSIEITDGSIVYFLKRLDRSEIGVLKEGVYDTIYNPSILADNDVDLKFDTKHPIEGEFKVQASGDVIVYWTDDLNPPRALNIQRQQESSPSKLYGKILSQSTDTISVNELNLFPHAGPVPHVELDGIFMGGGCKTGVYYLCLAYTDADLTETNYVTVAAPVGIVGDIENVSPIESYDGDKPGAETGKSIKWNISNLNKDKKYITPTIIQRVNGDDIAVKLKNIEIGDRTSMDIVYSGDSNYDSFSEEEVVIDNPSYVAAKTLNQLDNTLYIGNMRSNYDLGYQCYANNICVTPVTKEFLEFDPFVLSNDNLDVKEVDVQIPRDQGYRYANNIFDYMGYMREEVYAFYLAFVLKDGSMSYAYHIPGREAIENVPVEDIADKLFVTDPTVSERQTMWSSSDPDWSLINVGSGPLSYFFHWYDFSTALAQGSLGMNYWENLNEKYPDTADFDICNALTPNTTIGTLRDKNVRHHRFASNGNPDLKTITGSNSADTVVNTTNKAVVHWYYFGGLKHRADGTDKVEGVWEQGPDFWAAREYQRDNFPHNAPNSPMGGRYVSFSNQNGDVASALQSSSNNCFPPTNTSFNTCIMGGTAPGNQLCNGPVIGTGTFGCAVDSVDDISFVYDVQIPDAGQTVWVGWDAPTASHDSSGNGASQHCGQIMTATVNSVTEGDPRVVDLNHVSGPRSQYHMRYRGGWIAWVECEASIDSETPITHDVQALGFSLCDVMIPRNIANQVQGFRVYRAKRDHHNRTVLGQATLHPMGFLDEADISGCGEDATGAGVDNYWLAAGLPVRTREAHPAIVYSFHDFYLLNRTPNLSSATHLKLQYSMGMFNFKGSTAYYADAEADDPDADFWTCQKPQVFTSFHMGGDYQPFHGYDSAGDKVFLRNFSLYDKAKAYVPGNTIYHGKDEGFKKSIYNMGGESNIALRTDRFIPYLPTTEQAAWRGLRSDQTRSSFVNYTEDRADTFQLTAGFPENPKGGVMLHMANLKAFRTDVYDPVDKQELVWTGFEVLGDELEKFVVEDDGTPVNPDPIAPWRTGHIYGGDTYICRYGHRITHREELTRVTDSNNLGTDHKSVIFTIVESTENINYRHIESKEFPYFPGAPLAEVLRVKANNDLSYNPDVETGNMKYNEDYSSVNNIKKVFPLPWQLERISEHPVEVARSNKASASSLVDNYRQYSADQVKTLNNDRGELWKIIATDNVLLFHMEDSVYKAKGKQRMKTSGGDDAYIGQGDIFATTPDELQHTDAGYLGTRSQWASIVTPYGYFSIDNIKRRIFMIGKTIENLASGKYGMEDWFQRYMPYALEAYGFDGKIDSPISEMGYIAVWDERFSRVIVTKRDLKPTQLFIDSLREPTTNLGSIEAGDITPANGTIYIAQSERTNSPGESFPTWVPLPLEEGIYLERDAWTVSFAIKPTQDGKIGHWESFHDYVPYHYTYKGIDVISHVDGDVRVHQHNNFAKMSTFYEAQFASPFEVEMIHNEQSNIDKLYSAFDILVDVWAYDPNQEAHTQKDLHSGFTAFMTYTGSACSGVQALEYMINTRKSKNAWHVNKFRDISAEQIVGGQYFTGPYSGGNFGIPGANVAGIQNIGTSTNVNESLFQYDGMYEPFNPAYVDSAKPWHEQGKFIDRFFAIRLYANNYENKLINLYNTTATFRPFHR